MCCALAHQNRRPHPVHSQTLRIAIQQGHIPLIRQYVIYRLLSTPPAHLIIFHISDYSSTN
jgi:hypothetical protein